MRVPEEVLASLRDDLWAQADERHWRYLSQGDKAQLYEAWTRDPRVGGVLARYLDLAAVRVYIKDTLLKNYTRDRASDWEFPREVLGLPDSVVTVESFIKPHGRVLADGRVICWGSADNWKAVVMAVFERAHTRRHTRPWAVVLTEAVPRYASTADREVAEAAAGRLGVTRIAWFD